MKVKFTVPLLLFASLAIFSCSKENDSPTEETPNPQGGSLFVKMTQGLIPGDDTVFLVSYDANNRIKSIINSSWEDTLEATYNSAGNLSSTVEKSEFSAQNVNFSYNADNQLTQINSQANRYQEKYIFEYTNGVISKQSFYSNSAFNGVEPTLSRYYTYEVMNGNINSMKEYNDQNDFVAETKFTYNDESNIFKSISLLNTGNRLGADEIANLETFFNKNLLVSSSVSNSQTTYYTAAYTYTYNNKQLMKIVVSSPYNTLTRQLSY